jgi:hypothetical protein
MSWRRKERGLKEHEKFNRLSFVIDDWWIQVSRVGDITCHMPGYLVLYQVDRCHGICKETLRIVITVVLLPRDMLSHSQFKSDV